MASKTQSLERWLAEYVAIVTRATGRTLDDVLADPEEAARSGIGQDAAFALGVVVGASGALDLTPLELIDLLRPRPE